MMKLDASCFILLRIPSFQAFLLPSSSFFLNPCVTKPVVTDWPPRAWLQLTCTSHTVQKECKLSINIIMCLSTVSFRAKLLRIIKKIQNTPKNNMSSKLASIFKCNNAVLQTISDFHGKQRLGSPWKMIEPKPLPIQGNQIIPQVNKLLKTTLRHRGLMCPE